MVIREAVGNDLDGLLHLYTHLHEDSQPKYSSALSRLWERMVSDKDHHIIVGLEEGRIVSSCTITVIPNLTRGQRPYALVENVVTDRAFRGRGLASACLRRAKAIALAENCYKIMLLTGSREESTLRFYENAGYNRREKTAFIQRLGSS